MRPGDGPDWLLEERCLLAPADPVYMLPGPTVGTIDKVFYNGVTGSFQKYVTITNNSDQTVYAFLEGELTRQAVSPYDGTSAFDPYDPADQEYRGYIGYTDGTNQIAGLPAHSSITINVPLAFWDSSRINFSTDGASQFTTANAGSPAGAPFYYLDANTQAAFFASIDVNDNSKLNFTPIYNSFDPANGYLPYTLNWKSPVASGLFQNGQTYKVTGPGLPAAGAVVTIDSSHHNYVTLPQAGTPQTPAVGKYVFQITSAPTISPTDRYIQDQYAMTGPSGPSTNGLVMWYHALQGQVPNNDAPFQLFEVTFRGNFYDPVANPTARFQPLLGDAFAGSKVDSADYDLSFVDSINLPIAISARNVTVPYANVQAPFGWVGSSQELDDFQQTLAAFTSTNQGGSNTNFLGTYFGGRGYPTYLAIDPNNPKLPSGQNLFLASPMVNGLSDIQYYKEFTDSTGTYYINEPQYALSTGTPGPTQLVLGGDALLPSQGNQLALNTSNPALLYSLNDIILANIANGHVYDVTYAGGYAGRVTGPYRDGGGKVIGVTLDRPIPSNAGDQVYTFTQPQSDYATAAIAGLWYSWAQYFVEKNTSTAQPGLAGAFVGNIVTLTNPASGLVPGMAVTGNGVAPGTVVLSVGNDQKTIQLSAVPTGNPSSFSFARPLFSSIIGYDPTNTPLVDLTFTPAQQKLATAFAQTIFTVMSAWSVSVQAGTPNAWNPLLTNIIGGNLDSNYLPNANTDVVNALTVLSKSALRGVPDFTSPLYSNPALWYPDPALAAGGLSYNAFNLDPYVWFIHKKLGLTAYAFSLDDDIGNVEGGGANHIDIGVGGLKGLATRDPYTDVSQWGVVTTGASAQVGSSQLVNPATFAVVGQVAQFNYNKNQAGTIVNGTGVPMGTSVQFLSINTVDPTQTYITLSSPLTSVSDLPSYSFFGSLVFTGIPGQGPAADTITLKSADAYDTLLKVGPLENLQVTGEGIDPSRPVTIKGITKDPQTGAITVQVRPSLIPSLISQPGSFYAYSFGSAIVPNVRDPGFEWINVGNQSNQFNHGKQLSADVPDWTFSDSTSNANWFAGIAYGNTSLYTQGNPPPPQGLQVGFIQGNSSISQLVTLAAGRYTLSLQAAQAAANSLNQSLSITFGGTLVGQVAPRGTSYGQVSFNFNVAATGTYLLKFAGNQANTSTVLFDSVVLKSAGLSTGSPQQRHPAAVDFLVQPVSSGAGGSLAPVSVAVVDKSGRPWSGVKVKLSLVRIGRSRGHFVRGSVLSETTVDGLATFSHLGVSAPGRYMLRARVGRQRVLSTPFDIGLEESLLGRRHFVGRWRYVEGAALSVRLIRPGHAV